MQFQVPQFIETEDTVVGPLTLKQFGYLAAAGGISVLLFLTLNIWLWLILTALVGGTGAALAFFPVNGRPLINFVKALIDNIWQPKLYVFHPKISEPGATREVIPEKVKIEKSYPAPPVAKVPKIPFLSSLKQIWQGLIAPRKVSKPKVAPRIAPRKIIFREYRPASIPRPLPRPLRQAAPLKLSASNGLKGVWQWLATSKTAIPKRERPLTQGFALSSQQLKERYQVVRRLTGEREVARRIDYR